MQPNKEHIRAWVQALRSGEFKQTRAWLKKISPVLGASYCCLGVACEVAKSHGIELIESMSPGGNVVFNENGTSLPDQVRQWLGIDSVDPTLVNSDGLLITCVDANDDCGLDFDQIADLIEWYYLSEVNDGSGSDERSTQAAD